jgi:hypothetical protein
MPGGSGPRRKAASTSPVLSLLNMAAESGEDGLGVRHRGPGTEAADPQTPAGRAGMDVGGLEQPGHRDGKHVEHSATPLAHTLLSGTGATIR